MTTTEVQLHQLQIRKEQLEDRIDRLELVSHDTYELDLKLQAIEQTIAKIVARQESEQPVQEVLDFARKEGGADGGNSP